MSEKKVWSTILIVLGVVAVVHGLSIYRNMRVVDNGPNSVEAAIANYAEANDLKIVNDTKHGGGDRRGPWLSIILVLIGILTSSLGTYMIKGKAPRESCNTVDHKEAMMFGGPRFKI